VPTAWLRRVFARLGATRSHAETSPQADRIDAVWLRRGELGSAAALFDALRDAVGPGGRVVRFAWQNRHPAVPGDRLTCEGRKVAEDGGLAEYELVERNAEGTVCVTATATVRHD
jgi:hypothetical protein